MQKHDSIEHNEVSNNSRQTASNALLTAASWLADKRFSKKSSLNTKDLVTTLLSHGARAWRMSQPRGNVNLRSYNPQGFSAIRIKIK